MSQEALSSSQLGKGLRYFSWTCNKLEPAGVLIKVMISRWIADMGCGVWMPWHRWYFGTKQCLPSLDLLNRYMIQRRLIFKFLGRRYVGPNLRQKDVKSHLNVVHSNAYFLFDLEQNNNVELLITLFCYIFILSEARKAPYIASLANQAPARDT